MTRRALTEWELSYCDWLPAEQPLREALTTLGNGYFATRGAAEEAEAGGPHYPGTYLSGGYNRLHSEVAGRVIENEDLVNWPNWLPLTFRCAGSEWFDLTTVEVMEYVQALDLRHGVLSRRVRFRDRSAREFVLVSRRIVHMADPHLGAIEWELTCLNWSGTIEVCSAIDGRVRNSGVDRYRQLDGHHVEVVDSDPSGEDAIFLVARTRQSHIVMAQAARTRVFVGTEPVVDDRRTHTKPGWIGQHFEIDCRANTPVRVEKVVALYSSRDFAISEPRHQACTHVHRAAEFAELLDSHRYEWTKLWHRADMELRADDDRYSRLVLRLHIFHLLQTASLNTIGRDVSTPARGLHGEAYRGHIFWDELFIFPFLNLRIPHLARSLLLYRYRRLDEARHNAARAGYRGAMYPWQSGSDGREESQVVHLNPASQRWVPDNTYRQRHVSSAIAYNVWQYYQATGNTEFLSTYGAEMLVEIARFWASTTCYDAARDRYEIHGVVGPDEFHTHYPDTDGGGLRNNAYTNIMASWSLHTALVALQRIPREHRAELLQTLRVSATDLDEWDRISRRMYVPVHDDGIISQFEGWHQLDELDWEAMARRYGDIHRLDRLLEAEGDDVNRYKATKQADVLMLMYLFSTEELTEIFDRLGYDFRPEMIPLNVDYYLRRTSHGSTLSRVVHAWVLSRRDREGSWKLFRDVLASDIDDIQGGTTAEGVHLGAMGGAVDLMQRCYTGIEMRGDVLWLNPRLPDELQQLCLSVRYRHHWLDLRITHDTLVVAFERGHVTAARVGFAGEVYEMRQGQQMSFDLRKDDLGIRASARPGEGQ